MRCNSPSVRQVAVLSDFDGTISPRNVIRSIYEEFASGPWRLTLHRWNRGEIGTRHAMPSIFATMDASRDAMEEYLTTVSLDPAFPVLLDFCSRRGFVFAILSDGLTWYIELLLKQSGVRDVAVYANDIQFESAGYTFLFPWFQTDNPLRGTSKSAIARAYQEAGYRVVFIGDGLADTDAAEVADVVYARDVLLAYCRERRLPAMEFSSLADVLAAWKDPS